jgi:hypothetical protein
MELWIRSQDRESIFKVESVFYSTNEENEHFIRTFIIDDLRNGIVKLGQYETKERTLEVLDEIQNKINLINLGHDFGSPMIDLKNPTYIYQMPKE